MIDIDHFKEVNDCFGHLCGDEVILYVVAKINEINKRCGGWAARIGGDEFLLASPYGDAGCVTNVCEQLMAEIEGHSFKKVIKSIKSLSALAWRPISLRKRWRNFWSVWI